MEDAQNDPGSKIKSNKSVNERTGSTHVSESTSKNAIGKTCVEIKKANFGNIESNESESKLPTTQSTSQPALMKTMSAKSIQSDRIHIIKATSMSHKLSVNDQDECVRTFGDVSITVDGFGLLTTDKNTEVVKRFTLTNQNRMEVQIITLGATVTSIKVPDRHGSLEDVVLGFDTIEGFQTFFI